MILHVNGNFFHVDSVMNFSILWEDIALLVLRVGTVRIKGRPASMDVVSVVQVGYVVQQVT